MDASDPLFVKAVEAYVSEKGGYSFYADRVDPDLSFVDFNGYVVLKRRKTRQVLVKYHKSDLMPQPETAPDQGGSSSQTLFRQVLAAEVSHCLLAFNCKDNRYAISAYEDHLQVTDRVTAQAVDVEWSDIAGFKPVWVANNSFTVSLRNRGSYPLWVSTTGIPLATASTCSEICNTLEATRKRILAEMAIRSQQKLASGIQSYMMTIVSAHGLELPDGVMAEVSLSPESLLISLCDVEHNVRIPADEIVRIEVTGPGSVTTNAGLVGGGFGLEGAAWGIAAASLINAITTSSTTNTLLTVSTRRSSITLHTNQYHTEDLRLRLSSHIVAAEARAMAPPGAQSSELYIKLKELAELNSLGILTDDEFSKAKSKLLGI